MANDTSFDLDVEEVPQKPSSSKPIRTTPPKPKIHKIAKVKHPDSKKEIKKNQEQVSPPVPDNAATAQIPALELKVPTPQVKKVSNIQETTIPTIVQPAKKDITFPFDVHVDPTTAAVVGTLTVAAAGTAAAATGVATPIIGAFKAGIVKAKAVMGISSKAAAVAGTTAVGAIAMIALEKKFTDYEKDMRTAKEDVDEVSEQIKKLDALLDRVKSKK